MSIHLFGIRHHGPGSARSLQRALEALEPDVVLVEGPPDADGVLPLLSHGEMEPPVALLVYDPEKPERAVYYPFATYSPEWQAIRYAQGKRVPVRFMDLPQTHRMAIAAKAEEQLRAALEAQLSGDGPDVPLPDLPTETVEPADPIAGEEAGVVEAVPGMETEDGDGEVDLTYLFQDPLQAIAEAAGYPDGESWWEQIIEQRRDAADQFVGIVEMMCAVRDASPIETPESECQREAFMRQSIRAAEKEGFKKIAVVCGAWHTPALPGAGEGRTVPTAKEDAETLKGLPKIKTTATWIPWTYSRLTSASGYGAGVRSPAWYEHLWHHPDQVIERWMARAAQVLREEDLPASTASVIEAVRLSNTLASVRDQSFPGLSEMMEAAQSVFCFGSDLPMRLVAAKLVVGERLGKVPDETPMVPLQQNLRAEQRRLRMKVNATHEDVDYDLRNTTDLERSHLLHRLTLLGIPWGAKQRQGGGKGTFHELWRLQWQPEFEIRLIESNIYGNTVADAATSKVREVSVAAHTLPEITRLVGDTLNANLPVAVGILMDRLQALAAVSSDVLVLMDALPDLANVLRYGNVRKTDSDAVAHVVDGLLTRIVVGLPPACSSLDDAAAGEMYRRIVNVHNVVQLLQDAEHSEEWSGVLLQLADRGGLHGLVAGRACRLLLDTGELDSPEVGRRLNLALSVATDPPQAAAWVEGLLRDSGDILLHTDALWAIIDEWVSGLDADTFTQLLPLLRRTFATFPKPLRRQMGERVKSGGRVTVARGKATITTGFDRERGERVAPLVAKLLGLDGPVGTERAVNAAKAGD